MIPVRLAMAAVVGGCWQAWVLLIGRADDATATVLVLMLAGVPVWRFVASGGAQVPATSVAAALAAYALDCVTGPALLQIGAAAAILAVVAFRGVALPRLPIVGLAALLLPVLPTLDFLLAYPLRRVSAAITVALLRMNGVAVTLDGIALAWRGRLLLFDGPCSGVRMLWAVLVLASVVALARRSGPLGYARLLGVAAGIAVLGNALRAASLFYVENGYVAGVGGPIAHEAVGLLAFAMVTAAVIAATRPRWAA